MRLRIELFDGNHYVSTEIEVSRHAGAEELADYAYPMLDKMIESRQAETNETREDLR